MSSNSARRRLMYWHIIRLSPNTSQLLCAAWWMDLGCQCNVWRVCTILPRYLDKLWQIILKSFLWNANRLYAKIKSQYFLFLMLSLSLPATTNILLVFCCLHARRFFDAICAACFFAVVVVDWERELNGEQIYCLANWYTYYFIGFRFEFIFPPCLLLRFASFSSYIQI